MKSLEQVQEAVCSLTEAENLKLKGYAQSRVWKLRLKGHGYDEEDLFQEALTATIEGRRVWREVIDFFQHLTFTIKSISTLWCNKRKREYSESDLTEPGEESPLEQAATSLDPERSLRAKEVLEQIMKLFAGDLEALQVIELLGLKYTAKEIQEELAMSPLEVAATIKRIKRRLQKILELDSWQPVVNLVSQSKGRAKQSTQLQG